MSAPRISVVVPCFNGSSHLREALYSVLCQTLMPVEIIVVDDGSTDASREIAESFGHPVRVISQVNQGESVARNRGIEECLGEWVAFLDADDIWMPDKLFEQVNLISPNVGMVTCGTIFFRENMGAVAESYSKIVVPCVAQFRREWMLEHGAPCHISSVLVRKVYKTRFPEWTTHAEDVIFYLDLLDELLGVAVVATPLVKYRIHERAQSNHSDKDDWRDESYKKWFALKSDCLMPAERQLLERALQRREKHKLIKQALRLRQEGRPLFGLMSYGRTILQGLHTSTSIPIVSIALRGSIGSLAEVIGVKNPPIHPKI